MKKILIIAGSDSGGGAGIQADIKTATSLSIYASTAITAITAQNSTGVQQIFPLPLKIIKNQIKSVLNDYEIDTVKTGMLHSKAVMELVFKILQDYRLKNIILDPVMVATSGDTLIEPDAIEVIKNNLGFATLITPNLDEAKILSNIKEIKNLDDMEVAAQKIIDNGASAVLVKGGHLQGEVISDLFLAKNGQKILFTGKKINLPDIHGTGCTLATAIACNLCSGMEIAASIAEARKYITGAIENAEKLGHGSLNLNHFWHNK